MSQNINKILQNIASLSLLLPLIFYLFFQLRNKSKELRVILFYTIYSILNEGYGFYLHKIKAFSQYATLFDIFTVIEFCFFSYFFYLIIEYKKVKKLVLPITGIFIIFGVVYFFFLKNSSSFNSMTSGVEAVLIIAMCIYYFFEQLKQPSSFLIYSMNFWIIISFLIYLSGTFFLYIMAENMINDKAFFKQYSIINSGFNILKNLLLSVAMLMKTQERVEYTFPEETLDTDWNNFQSLKNPN